MAELAAFQDAFIAALHDATRLDRIGDAAQLANGFSVYRNTVHKGMRDALAANFPTVVRLVGDDWFAACAAAYGTGRLPQRASLFDYGADFADFLDDFAPAAELVYLGDVARIDRWWIEAHVAADAPVLPADALAGLAPAALFGARAALHPSVRLGWCATPAPSIWAANRHAGGEAPEIDWQAEGVLLARSDGAVMVTVIDAATYAFVDACCVAATLGEAASLALAVDAGFDVAGCVAMLLRQGIFTETRTRME